MAFVSGEPASADLAAGPIGGNLACEQVTADEDLTQLQPYASCALRSGRFIGGSLGDTGTLFDLERRIGIRSTVRGPIKSPLSLPMPLGR